MQRESQKDRTILCKYEPTEPGDYRIEVKWSGEHVPGSPMMVMIFDTQEELSKFLQVSPIIKYVCTTLWNEKSVFGFLKTSYKYTNLDHDNSGLDM